MRHDAFPCAIEGVFYPGMTLRDYFAAAAMQTIVGTYDNAAKYPDLISKESYKIADAMLEARKQ